MEATECSQRWRTHLPKFKRSKRRSTINDRERVAAETEARNGAHKSVTMAATSRYLTDRHYVMRRPLLSEEQHTSILKRTHPQEVSQKEAQLAGDRREDTTMKSLTSPKDNLIPRSFSVSHRDISPPPDSPLRVSVLQGSPAKEPTYRSDQHSLSSSVLDLQRPNPPLRPRLTSTVLYPTYTPRSGFSRSGQTLLRLGGREGRAGRENNWSSPRGRSTGVPESPYQANYWACAIPKSLPPSPERRSPGWDPNKEYQALLDYTYPLRPGEGGEEWGSSELQGDNLLQTDHHLQDSGIELHRLWSSTSLSGLDSSISRAGQTRERSPDLQGSIRLSEDPASLAGPRGYSTEQLDCGEDSGGVCDYRSGGEHHQHHALSSTWDAFIRSTSVLPLCRRAAAEVDEEFRPLPEQLEELQLLSRQVREVTAQLSCPVTTSWESLQPDTASVLSSVSMSEKQGVEEEEEAEVKEFVEDKPDKNNGSLRSTEEGSAAQAGTRVESGTVRSPSGAGAKPAGVGPSLSAVREVEALVERLRGLTLPHSQRSSRVEQQQSDSLMEHIQAFGSHLELLIQQLYLVSEKLELLTAPTVDIDSVKSSLAGYQSFQREVSSQQPLASSALHAGQLLLGCINDTSPFLRDTLLLIETQCGSLQTHTEEFFSSILTAMDRLTQPSECSADLQCTQEDPVEIHGLVL
ncbi:centrosomal protein of 68 kDa isoform 1-T2 [Pholidichthys leucotaenia]